MRSAVTSLNCNYSSDSRAFLYTCNVSSYNTTTQPYIGGFCPSVPMWSIQTISSRLARPTHLFFNHNFQMCVCTHTVCVLGKHPELKRINEGTLLWSKRQNPAYWEILSYTEPPRKWYFKPPPTGRCSAARSLWRELSSKFYIQMIIGAVTFTTKGCRYEPRVMLAAPAEDRFHHCCYIFLHNNQIKSNNKAKF